MNNCKKLIVLVLFVKLYWYVTARFRGNWSRNSSWNLSTEIQLTSLDFKKKIWSYRSRCLVSYLTFTLLAVHSTFLFLHFYFLHLFISLTLNDGSDISRICVLYKALRGLSNTNKNITSTKMPMRINDIKCEWVRLFRSVYTDTYFLTFGSTCITIYICE